MNPQINLRDEKIRLLEELNKILRSQRYILAGWSKSINYAANLQGLYNKEDDLQKQITSLTEQIKQETPQSKESDERGKEVKMRTMFSKWEKILMMDEGNHIIYGRNVIIEILNDFKSIVSQDQPDIIDKFIEQHAITKQTLINVYMEFLKQAVDSVQDEGQPEVTDEEIEIMIKRLQNSPNATMETKIKYFKEWLRDKMKNN